MIYNSTRSKKKYSFKDIILNAMPKDNGLFMPEKIKKINFKKKHLKDYHTIISYILSKYMKKSEYKKFNIKKISKIVYKKKSKYFFSNIDKLFKFKKKTYVLDLNYGKTLSFKDFSLSFISEIINFYLNKKKIKKNVMTATSGDTGSSCSYYNKNKNNLKTFILSPYRKISKFQENQMFSIVRKNIYNITINGNFDDCQSILKKNLVNIENFCTFNSVNFLRLLIQSAYYIKNSFLLYKKYKSKINFSIPTGNFGNAFSAFLAKSMGGKINKIIVTTNENDNLYHFFKNKKYIKKDKVLKTNCPSMDISIASNLERYIYLLFKKCYKSKKIIEKKIRFKKFHFKTFRCKKNERNKKILNIFKNNKIIIDTHTANSFCSIKNKKGIYIIINTANHIKFYKKINKIIKKKLKYKFSEKLKKLKKKSFYFKKKDLIKIKNFILKNKN